MSDEKKSWDDGADFYSTSDQVEHLTHEDIDECLEARFENTLGSTEFVAAKGVTIYAWARMTLDVDAEARRRLDSFVLELSESIYFEYGNADVECNECITTEAAETFKAAVLPEVVKLLETVKPWRCSQVGERTFSADELLAWVRKHNPEWLENQS